MCLVQTEKSRRLSRQQPRPGFPRHLPAPLEEAQAGTAEEAWRPSCACDRATFAAAQGGVRSSATELSGLGQPAAEPHQSSRQGRSPGSSGSRGGRRRGFHPEFSGNPHPARDLPLKCRFGVSPGFAASRDFKTPMEPARFSGMELFLLGSYSRADESRNDCCGLAVALRMDWCGPLRECANERTPADHPLR